MKTPVSLFQRMAWSQPLALIVALLVVVSPAMAQEASTPRSFIALEKSNHDRDEVDFNVRIRDSEGDGTIKFSVKIEVEDEDSDELDLRLIEHSEKRGVVQAIIVNDVEVVLRLDVGHPGLLQKLNQPATAQAVVELERQKAVTSAPAVRQTPAPAPVTRQPASQPAPSQVVTTPQRKAPAPPVNPNPSQLIQSSETPKTAKTQAREQAKEDPPLPTSLEPSRELAPKEETQVTQRQAPEPPPTPARQTSMTQPPTHTEPVEPAAVKVAEKKPVAAAKPKKPAAPPKPPAKPITTKDVDGDKFAVNEAGKVSFVMICSESTQDAAREMGAALNAFAGIPEFCNPVIVDLTGSWGGGFALGITKGVIRGELDEEAKELAPIYSKRGNPANPRDALLTVADDGGKITEKLGFKKGTTKLRGVLYDASGHEVDRWDGIDDPKDIVKKVRMQMEAAGVDFSKYEN